MNKELLEKLEKLDAKFNTDVDIISLKALCQIPENEQIILAITATLERLINKYPDDRKILNLLPKKKISLEELIKILEEKYLNDVEVTTIKALANLPDGEAKKNAVTECLKRLLERNSTDQNILEYLDIKEAVFTEPLKDMIFVEGGTFIPSFFDKERTTFDLYVSKYDVTNDEWDEMMDKNPSKILGARKPVNNVSRIEAFEYCNALSRRYGLEPVYKIENDRLAKIVYKNGKEEYPSLADFRKTEGYRLPTEIEWEWFSWGGKVAQKNGTFDKESYKKKEKKDRGSSGIKGLEIFADIMEDFAINPPNYNDVAWDNQTTIHDVGLKKPNELGLYDVIGNVSEHVYDTLLDNCYITDEKNYVYDEEHSGCLRGGDCQTLSQNSIVGSLYSIRNSATVFGISNIKNTGFRIVRTAKPIK